MSNSLYCEVNGHGQHVVLLHGWGMHGGLWGKFNELLSESYTTHAIDLPGYGFSKNINSEFTLDVITEVVESYIKKIDKPAFLVGWSLGGLIALNIIKRKKISVEKVVFIASTPSFTKKLDWDTAMEQSVFDAFSNDLQTDYEKTLKRFLSLQTRGSELEKKDLRKLNDTLNERGEPNFNALEKGLEILSQADLRCDKNTRTSIMVILGEKDTLIPVSVKDEFKRMFEHAEIAILKKTGHAPFISKPELCAEKIKNFINE